MSARTQKRLLLVSIQFPPWGGGGVMRMTKLVRYLDPVTWQVEVVSSDERHPEVVDPTLLAEIPASVVVTRIRGPFRGPGGAAKAIAMKTSYGRLIGSIAGAAKLAARALLIPDRWIGWSMKVARTEPGLRPDIVVSSGPPHSAHLGASLLARRLGVPHVVDLRDEWAGNPMHRHPAPWHAPVNNWLERWCLLRAAHVVVVAEVTPGALVARHPQLQGRVTTIPNGFDPADLLHLPARVPAAPDRPTRFIFAGSLHGTGKVGRFFEAFGDSCRSAPGSLHMEMLGYFGPRQRRAAEAEVPGPDLTIRDPVPHAEALQAMAASDVLVVFTGEGGWGAGTFTGKLYEYLALRRPVLVVGPPGPAVEFVRSARAGTAADPDDIVELSAAIAEAVSMARDPGFAGVPGALLDPFTRQHLANEWSDLLVRIAEREMSTPDKR